MHGKGADRECFVYYCPKCEEYHEISFGYSSRLRSATFVLANHEGILFALSIISSSDYFFLEKMHP